ncbi:MAG: hypothetical protein WBP88_10120 [Nitrososphaeraceae archaeon]
MSFKIVTWIFCITILLFSIYSTIHLNSATAQIGNWKKYSNTAIKFKFFYPPNWSIKTTHDNITGTTEVILVNPNSTRAQISILHNPNEPTLSSKTGKPVVPSRALTNLEKEISVDYVFFNSTGKFPHRYSISDHQSASDVIDYEKSKGKSGKMLIVFAKVNDKDALIFTYTESKRQFYKNLSNISQIIKSIAILE